MLEFSLVITRAFAANITDPKAAFTKYLQLRLWTHINRVQVANKADKTRLLASTTIATGNLTP